MRVTRRCLAIFVAMLLMPWHTPIEPAPLAAASQPFSVVQAESTPSPAAAGESVSFETRVKARAGGSASVEMLVTNSNGEVVWQDRLDGIAFRRNQTLRLALNWDVPADQGPGDYLLTVRVWGADGNEGATPSLAPFAIITAEPAPTPPAGDLEPEEAAFLTLVNDYRQSHGLAPLSLNPHLTAAAEWMSWDMATKNYVSHTDSLGRDPFTRMTDFDYTADTWKGENIAAGFGGAAQVFDGWRASDAHNANMLNPNYTVIGIGRASRPGSRYGVYWTTDFGGE